MNKETKRLVTAALFAAMTCVATMVIKVPSPLNGYLNLGDCIVLLAGWMLSPLYGFLAAGIGSALADVLSGYVMYAPATFIIKGMMALSVCLLHKVISKKKANLLPIFISGIAAEFIMVFGYFAFEGLIYGFPESAVNMPANIIQGIAGLALGIPLVKVFEKVKLTF
jgi:uncharacterized membrane protein